MCLETIQNRAKRTVYFMQLLVIVLRLYRAKKCNLTCSQCNFSLPLENIRKPYGFQMFLGGALGTDGLICCYLTDTYLLMSV